MITVTITTAKQANEDVYSILWLRELNAQEMYILVWQLGHTVMASILKCWSRS